MDAVVRVANARREFSGILVDYASGRLSYRAARRRLLWHFRRFTVQAEKHFNLLASDMGRSISKVRHNFKLPDLERLIAEVIDTVMREAEAVLARLRGYG